MRRDPTGEELTDPRSSGNRSVHPREPSTLNFSFGRKVYCYREDFTVEAARGCTRPEGPGAVRPVRANAPPCTLNLFTFPLRKRLVSSGGLAAESSKYIASGEQLKWCLAANSRGLCGHFNYVELLLLLGTPLGHLGGMGFDQAQLPQIAMAIAQGQRANACSKGGARASADS